MSGCLSNAPNVPNGGIKQRIVWRAASPGGALAWKRKQVIPSGQSGHSRKIKQVVACNPNPAIGSGQGSGGGAGVHLKGSGMEDWCVESSKNHGTQEVAPGIPESSFQTESWFSVLEDSREIAPDEGGDLMDFRCFSDMNERIDQARRNIVEAREAFGSHHSNVAKDLLDGHISQLCSMLRMEDSICRKHRTQISSLIRQDGSRAVTREDIAAEIFLSYQEVLGANVGSR
ncbi:hypothetical protein Dimus_004927, partial [Dionaea muscipula]